MKSSQNDCIAPSRKGKHLNESERQQIERWLLKGLPVKQIATLLQRHPSSIYREIKRGTVTNIRSDLSEYPVYRDQRAQADYLCNFGAGGPYLKLAWDSEIAKRLHTLMTVNKMSPYAAIEIARQEKLNINFCARSLTQNDINRLAEWMNRYPRRIFEGKSARLMVRAEKLHFIKFAA